MSSSRLNRLGLSLCLTASCWLGAGIQAQESESIRGFSLINRYQVGAVAEIISAGPEGEILAYTNAEDQLIGILDISDPDSPEELGTVDVSELGEPTSVVITPDGQYAVAAVLDLIDEEGGETIADQQPGQLVFIDLESLEITAELELNGIGPDSVAITPDGERILVAIEDEEDEDTLPGERPGSIDIVAVDPEDPTDSEVSTLELDLSEVEGVNYPEDPQPEFISVNPEGSLAAVSLQENNAIAILDLESEEVLRIFSAGTSSHQADLTEEGTIDLSEAFEGRREPDTIAFTPDGEHLVLLNEGDTDLERFGDDIWSGGRGWSIVDLEGDVIYDSGSDVEELAVLRGQYPERRSENRGVEMEGGTSAQYGDQPLAFVASERGSFLLAYDISDLEAPELISFLPTGLAPEGILAIPDRGLLLSANEVDGTIDIFQTSDEPVDPYTETEPLVIASSLDTPFSAISGNVAVPDREDALYAIPDSAIAPSQIYTMELEDNRATVTESLILTLDGEPVSYDLEGIAVDPEGGFWLVSEGDTREGRERPNLLIRANADGEVEEEITLPEEDAAAITRFGFEGVTPNEDGSQVFVAVQREFEEDPENQVRIYRYTVEDGSWTYFFYPLDTDNVDGWVGLSEIASLGDDAFLVIERDNQGGANGAANARVKRVYEFSLEDVDPESMVEKTLVVDLLEEHTWLEEKAEGLAIVEGGFWVSSDNDGGETYTRLLFIEQ